MNPLLAMVMSYDSDLEESEAFRFVQVQSRHRASH
jgi:hypothetical protein